LGFPALLPFLIAAQEVPSQVGELEILLAGMKKPLGCIPL
jgi:hypothetical protein